MGVFNKSDKGSTPNGATLIAQGTFIIGGKFEGRGIRKKSDLKSRYSEIEQKINNIIVTPFAIAHEKS